MTNGIEKKLDIPAFLEYEHRDRYGKLRGSGKMKRDKARRTFVYQYDGAGKEIAKLVYDRLGNELVEKNVLGIKTYALKENIIPEKSVEGKKSFGNKKPKN